MVLPIVQPHKLQPKDTKFTIDVGGHDGDETRMGTWISGHWLAHEESIWE
jgi:hypothetical protein